MIPPEPSTPGTERWSSPPTQRNKPRSRRESVKLPRHRGYAAGARWAQPTRTLGSDARPHVSSDRRAEPELGSVPGGTDHRAGPITTHALEGRRLRSEPETCSPARLRSAAEHLAVGVLIEADQHRVPHHQGWRTEVSGGSQEGRHGVLLGCAAVEFRQLLALGDDDPIRRADQLAGIRFAELAACGNGFCNLDAACIQELGCFRAARSTVAVVVPVDLHGSLR